MFMNVFANMIFYIASAIFIATFLLGVLVQFRIVDSSGFRWLHHALFFLVVVSAAVSCLWGIFAGEVYGWVMLPVLILYFFLPRIRAGTLGHAILAMCALILYVAGFILISL